MATINAVSGAYSSATAFVTQIYDLRDSNEDGKVTVLEDYLYTSRHHKKTVTIPVPNVGSTFAAGDPAAGGTTKMAVAFVDVLT